MPASVRTIRITVSRSGSVSLPFGVGKDYEWALAILTEVTILECAVEIPLDRKNLYCDRGQPRIGGGNRNRFG
jgi:hypothetical protein